VRPRKSEYSKVREALGIVAEDGIEWALAEKPLLRYYFTEHVEPTVMRTTFQNILCTIRDAGFQAFKEGQTFPDGRKASANRPLRHVGRFCDDVQQVWQDVIVPDAGVVADETMVGWAVATNIYITILPNKPTSKGVCWKTLCDTSTRIMVAMEFVEG
jgi:hypothetical protein